MLERFVRNALPACLVGVLVACDGGKPRKHDAGVAVRPVPTVTTAPSVASARVPDAATGESADAAAGQIEDAGRAVASGDAGGPTSACRIAYGPAELPFWGAASLVMSASELRVVTNDGGKPRVHAVPVTAPPPPGAPPVSPPRALSFEAMRGPPCEVAGKWAFCPGPGGLVQRSELGGTATKTVAKSRPGTRVAASLVGATGEHAVVAYLDTRKTSEGDTVQAFVAIDEQEPVRLSEDGAGATSVRLVARSGNVVAVYMDARSAMLPLHARPLTLLGDKLSLGTDAVVFIGGPPERGVDFTLAGAGRSLFALVPMPKETATFGVAAVPIEDPPKDDVSAVWSTYPNGLDPAPIAATTRLGEGGPVWVARVRPKEAPPASPRVLELGKLDGTGRFTALGTVAEGRSVVHVAIAADTFGALWLVYGDRSGSWLERLVCP